MKYDDVTHARHGADCMRQGWGAERFRKPGGSLQSGERGLEAFAGYLADQCAARSVLLLWHASESGAEPIYCSGIGLSAAADLGACRERAIDAAAQIMRQPSRQQAIFADDDAALAAAIALDGGVVTITSVLKVPSQDSAARCRTRVEKLLPLAKAFFEQWLAMERVLARMQSLTQALESSDMAIILLGGERDIVYANAAAERMLQEQDGLRRCGERLACNSFGDTLRLQAAIDHLNVTGSHKEDLNPVLALPRVKGRRSLTIALTAAQPRYGSSWDEVRAIAYVFDPEEDLTAIVEPVCRLYGLTQSETKLTCALVDGASLAEAAKRSRLSEQTGRSYLKQIFAKTETQRQAELVQLMLKSAIRMCCEGRTQAFT